MSTNENLLAAALMIKEHCENAFRVSSHEKCDCPFCAKCGDNKYYCTIKASLPKFYKIKRWTDADIALAKALKAFGAEIIGKSPKEDFPYWKCAETRGGGVTCGGALPNGAFETICSGEKINIDDIIEEEEHDQV